jgi:hypothetical protein
MKLAKSIFYGAISLALMLGSANASSEAIDMESATEVSAIYSVDEDHDGRTDHTLELEQSDSLA